MHEHGAQPGKKKQDNNRQMVCQSLYPEGAIVSLSVHLFSTKSNTTLSSVLGYRWLAHGIFFTMSSCKVQ